MCAESRKCCFFVVALAEQSPDGDQVKPLLAGFPQNVKNRILDISLLYLH